jgi:hypothetical protein
VSPLTENKQTVEHEESVVAGTLSYSGTISGTSLLPDVSGHNVLLLSERTFEKTNDKRLATQQLISSSLKQNKQCQPASEDDLDFVQSSAFLLENVSDHPQEQHFSNKIASHNETIEDTTDQYSLGLSTDQDEYLQVAKTDDGTQYL